MEDQPLKKKKVTSPPLPTWSGTTNGPVSQKGASEVTVQNAEYPGLFREKKKKKNIVRHQREGLASLKIFAKADIQGAGVRVQRARLFQRIQVTRGGQLSPTRRGRKQPGA